MKKKSLQSKVDKVSMDFVNKKLLETAMKDGGFGEQLYWRGIPVITREMWIVNDDYFVVQKIRMSNKPLNIFQKIKLFLKTKLYRAL